METPMSPQEPSQRVPRTAALWLALPLVLAGNMAFAQRDPNPAAIIGGFMGLMGAMAQQAQQQQQQEMQRQQWQAQQQQQIQQQQLQQQQIEAERQRAAAEARERVRQRQQAEADAAARQKQAEAKAAAEAKARAELQVKQAREAASKLRADPAFLPILGPDGRDVTVLVVGQENANVVRSLKGEVTFENGANACLPFGTISFDPGSLEARFLINVKSLIEAKGGITTSSLLLTNCNASEVAGYDLLVFSREQLGNGAAETLSQILDLIRRRQFVHFATFTIADFAAQETAKLAAIRAQEARALAERDAAAASFRTRDPDVISSIHTAAPARSVCLISADPEGLRYLLKRPDSPFAATIPADAGFRDVASGNALFIALKRQDCFAAVGPAGVLREVLSGLARDGFKAEVDGGTLSDDRLAGWRALALAELMAAQDRQKEAETLQRQREARQAVEVEQKRIKDEQRRKNDEVIRREELDRMRKLVASRASAVMDGFAKQVRGHLASMAAEVSETRERARSGQVLSAQDVARLRVQNTTERLNFAPWAGEVEILAKEGWDFGASNASIEDYGRARWKDRSIEAIVVRVEIPMINRIAGEKKVACYDFAWINDAEFEFMRQTMATRCDEYGPRFSRWAEANAFVSEWNLLPPS
jgi:flagellar biosynthesis GTPase FlhF